MIAAAGRWPAGAEFGDRPVEVLERVEPSQAVRRTPRPDVRRLMDRYPSPRASVR